MGKPQDDFVTAFKEAFLQKFDASAIWTGGQVIENFAYLPRMASLRRGGKSRQDERFELGDLRTNFFGRTIIVEYDSGGVDIQNLLKYWPYVRGELNLRPEFPLVLCHFSNWKSYGSYRDLWNWLLSRIQADSELIVEINGCQFDHRGDKGLQDSAIQEALDWLSTLFGR
jgi:hypothetical protein